MRIETESPLVLISLVVVPVVLMALRYTLVDTPRLQHIVSFLIRSCVLILLILALAGALLITRSSHLAVLVVADLSDSVPKSAPEQVKSYLKQLEQRPSNPTMTGLLTFAAAAEIYVPLQKKATFPDEIPKPKETTDTSIEGALLRARAIMPSDTINRVVVLSDGNETKGDAISAAKRCGAHGIRIFTAPYTSDQKDEVLLEDLIVPPEVKRGQSFAVTAIAHSTVEGDASFTLYRNGFKAQETQLHLKPGPNTLSFDETNPADGLTKYELRVTAAKDFFSDNNVSSGIVFVSGEPRVLLLEGEEREARYLARSLEAEGIVVEVREGKGMPGNLDEMAAFDAVMVSDVPATDLSVRQMNLLRSYVEDLGGGLVMIGGEESFALGGYYRTAIEDALPVRMRSEKKKDTPSLAMMLIIDKSGSMEGEKVEMAKEAAIAATELLGPKDYVGVIAFDSEPYWVVDLQSAGNKTGITQTIASIEAGGGTSMYPPMVDAHDALQRIQASLKHAVLLTDGQSQPGDFEGITQQMASDLITVSSVAIGDGADTVLLQDIARWGSGRYYFTADAYDIPQIFTKETMAASKSSLIEEPFLPQVFQTDQVIRGIDWKASPFLFGYVVTSAKSTAKVSLITERGDPLLASWQFGLGKSVAFTSDAKSRWASDWLSWPGFGQFWSQVVRDVMRTSRNQGAETHIALKGESGSLAIDNVDENGNFVNNLTTTVQVINPDLTMSSLSLAQTGPGHYESAAPMKSVGSYLFKIRQTTGAMTPAGTTEEVVVSDYTRGMTISYKPEYRHLSTNEGLLRQLAEVTGGKYQPTMEDVFAVGPDESVPTRRPLWPWLLASALVIFVVDVAMRRLDLAGWRLFGPPGKYG